jgi:hypothetical protein
MGKAHLRLFGVLFMAARISIVTSKNNRKGRYIMKAKYFFPLTIIITVIISIAVPQAGFSASHLRHAVIYGGIPDTEIQNIVNSYDILVLDYTAQYKLVKMKQLKPGIKLLKYVYVIGSSPEDPHWSYINKMESWFVHDKNTGKRMVDKYGSYLMDLGNSAWRSYVCNNIANEVDPNYDGIFVDDIWESFYPKYVCEGTSTIATPPDSVKNLWQTNIIKFFNDIKTYYPKILFINGAYNVYMNYIDGCMEEEFIHANWTSDSYFYGWDGCNYMIQKLDQLSKQGKTILVESGTMNDGTGDINKLARLCYASYLLISNQWLSFSFQPTRSYAYYGIFRIPEYDLDLGTPSGAYFTLQTAVLARKFTKGLVVANYGNNSVTLNLSTYGVSSGGSVTLGAREGKFFASTVTIPAPQNLRIY